MSSLSKKSTQCYLKIDAKDHLDMAFLGTVLSSQETAWFAKIQLSDQVIFFKLDTGAEVTTISDLVTSVWGNLTYRNKSMVQPVFAVSGLKSNLLGLPAITALNLAASLDATTEAKSDIREKFPSVFHGLGNLSKEYRIKLKVDAKP